MWNRSARIARSRHTLRRALLFVFLVQGALLLSGGAVVSGRAALPALPADSSTLPSGSNVQLGPTYADTGAVATVSVGQDTTFKAVIPTPCAGPCWLQQGYPIDLYVVEASHVASATACAQSTGLIEATTQTSYDYSSGTFYIDGGFTWPAAATSTAYGSPWYALCIHVEVPANSGLTGVQDYVTGAVADEQGANTTALYKVISDHAPTVTVSPLTAAQGQTLTITGHHWVPVYTDEPNTLVGACIDQYPYAYATVNLACQQANVSSNGDWTLTFPIPTSYAPGAYYACVGATNFHTYCQGWKTGVPFTVVQASAAPTATPSSGSAPTATPSTSSVTASPGGTPTASIVASTTPTPGSSATPSLSGGGDAGGPPWLAIILALVVLASLAGAGVFLFTRRAPPYRP